jgi:hypothetical protein
MGKESFKGRESRVKSRGLRRAEEAEDIAENFLIYQA